MKRYALLDTDFISKTHSVQDDGGNHLIDRVMELPGYEFFCHAQIVTELNRYNADAPIWLSEKIGVVRCPFIQSRHSVLAGMLLRKPASSGNSRPVAGRREERNPGRCTRSSGTRGIRNEGAPPHSILPPQKVQ